MLATRVRFLDFLVLLMLHFGLLSFLLFPESRQFYGLSTNLEVRILTWWLRGKCCDAHLNILGLIPIISLSH